ncbi:MAG: class I SAM-dependent methyltransferase, partial [Terriglobales bacterium]
ATTRPATPGTTFRCAAGHAVAQQEDGWVAVGASIPYWGELPRENMLRLLQAARSEGWRQAVRHQLAPELAGYIGGRERADFEALLPLAPEARVLDVGAGWGGIAAILARRYEVIALEGVRERAEFIAVRGSQDKLERLTVVQGDIHSVPLLPGQFDLIVANGMLEWSALLDTGAPVRAVQMRFLHRLHNLLAPGGMIYLAIENRFGLAALRGARDHSGLSYTSLLPRPLARWVCSRHSQYRAQTNRGYRTYTYSLRGYRRLFAQAELQPEAVWFCPRGYNLPVKLVPIATAPLAFCCGRAAAMPAATDWRRRLRQAALRGGAMRWLASDFAFVLRPQAVGRSPFPMPSSHEARTPCTSLSGS